MDGHYEGLRARYDTSKSSTACLHSMYTFATASEVWTTFFLKEAQFH